MYDPSFPFLRPAATTDGPPAAQAKARFAEDRLLDALLWCEIAPGAVVTEADAMERFGLTRAAARAGLTRLGYDGWAMPQPRTGWLVLPITGALIGHVLDARRIAESALGDVKLTADARAELIQIDNMLQPLKDRAEAGALSSFNAYMDRVDGVLLGAMNPFTARHLRKLWHHTARMTRFLQDPAQGRIYRRSDAAGLIKAALAEDGPAICDSRVTLIEEQQAFFLKQLLNSDAPLTPGNVMMGQTKPTTFHRREI